jgi:8-oxo-dGTP diphosphatase
MIPLTSVDDVAWAPLPNAVRICRTDRPPPKELVTAVEVIAHRGDKLALVSVRGWGWDLPGGHVESGESPAEAVRREATEEAGITIGPVTVVGCYELTQFGRRPQSWPYPWPVGYITIYQADVIAVDTDHQQAPDTAGRGFFSTPEVRRLTATRLWHPIYLDVVEPTLGT